MEKEERRTAPLLGGDEDAPRNDARIMIVDDDPTICDVIGDSLRPEGYDVSAFGSAEDALNQLESSLFDLVILDLKLPGMDGIEALHAIKDKWPDIDVIIMTGYTSVESAVESMQLGAADYIPKPFTPDHLLVVIRKTLYRRLLEIKARERDLYARLATIDAVTDVYNHRFFQEILGSEVARAHRYGQVVSLLMADVDDFKKYNDRNGHQAGDEALRRLAAVMVAESRTSDHVARYGGEEFAVVLCQTGKKGAAVYAERVRTTLSKTEFYNQEKQPAGQLTVSMGLAGYPQDATSKEDLIRQADRAMYKAKHSGKDQLCVWTLTGDEASS